QSAYNTLQVISQDEEKRMEYEAREKAIRDYNQGMLEAEQRGEQLGWKEAKENIAKNMLAMKLPIDMIAQVTGLSVEQIKSLSGD
ncbi:MAG: Rpn family recombination-promoting nuclease/putative transposase, partial [Lachnospiraceae bacterium]|nr:Rpn family recombination-promoting nuclease/putative transposase [Lachnospiraceae bacterium]